MIASRIQFEFDVQYTWHTTAVKVFRRIYSKREKSCKPVATAVVSSPKQNAYFNWILRPMRFTLILLAGEPIVFLQVFFDKKNMLVEWGREVWGAWHGK